MIPEPCFPLCLSVVSITETDANHVEIGLSDDVDHYWLVSAERTDHSSAADFDAARGGSHASMATRHTDLHRTPGQ